VDFYPESGLMWLEADTIIRQQSGRRRSLDDFCKLFFGPRATSQPYTFDDVVAALNTVLPYDWKAFLHGRLESLSAEPPLGGIERSGWKLVYTDEKSELITDMEQIHKVDLLWPEWQKWGFADLRSSIGLLVQDDGTVLDSAPGLSGYDAGVMPGMQLTSVNGGQFSLAALAEAVRGTRDGGKLDLRVANGNSSATYRLDYHGGLRYPHLQRDPSKPDLLSEIAAPQGTTLRSPRQ
jgi:predicted metalloprotease with PDZ domain